MRIHKLENGNLEMRASKADRRYLGRMRKRGVTPLTCEKAERIFITSKLRPKGFVQTLPELHGCLTSAPLITDGKDVWGFMDYAVTAFLERLYFGENIIWQKG